MHTQVRLSSIGQLVDGTHENPSSVLGPHSVDYRGESAIAVRSYLPEAQAAWIIDSSNGMRRPMRQLHPAGFFEAICDGAVDGGKRSEEDARSVTVRKIEIPHPDDQQNRRSDRHARPVRRSIDPDRL